MRQNGRRLSVSIEFGDLPCPMCVWTWWLIHRARYAELSCSKLGEGTSLNSPLPSFFLIHHLLPLPPALPIFFLSPSFSLLPFSARKIPPSRPCSFKVASQTSIWVPRLAAVLHAFQHQSLYPELFLWSFFSYRKWNLRVCIASSLQQLFPLQAFQLFPSLSVSEPESFLTMRILESVFPLFAAEWMGLARLPQDTQKQVEGLTRHFEYSWLSRVLKRKCDLEKGVSEVL